MYSFLVQSSGQSHLFTFLLPAVLAFRLAPSPTSRKKSDNTRSGPCSNFAILLVYREMDSICFHPIARRALASYLLLLIGSLQGVAQSPGLDQDAWVEAIASERSRIAKMSPDKRDQAAREGLYTLSKRFPVMTDWVHQDARPSPHALLLEDRAKEIESLLLHNAANLPETSAERLAVYASRCLQRREDRLRPVLDRWAPFACSEMHSVLSSFIGYTEGLSDARHERFFKPGARLSLLHFDGDSLFARAEKLIDDPHGMIRDVDVSYDSSRLLFAWKKSDRLDDYHIYELNLSDKNLRQLTSGIGRADYEPVYLPDGDIVFASTRPEQSVPCWYSEISNLYRMNGEGRFVRRLAVDQVHTLYPQVLNDGRICYTRWDYSDRGQNYPHPVFSMDPDGQAQRVYYGGNSWFPNSLLHTRPIPGSTKVLSIAAGHHTHQHGKLVMIDVRQGRDEGVGMAFVAPRREVPYERVDMAMQGGDQFRYPFPLSEDDLLVSYRPDWGIKRDNTSQQDENDFALYWMNLDGGREYLHGDPTLGIQRPVALGHKPSQPIIPDTVDYKKSTGTLYVHDVYQGVGLQGVPRGEAKKLRVVRLNYRAAGIGQTFNRGEGGSSINSSPVSIGNGSWDIKEIIGDADIHEDGSVLFEVPANESLYLQVLDARGRVLQTTRTWDTVRPGETKGCVGCHDKGNANYYPFQREPTLAWNHGVQKLQPFHGPTRGFSFAKEIQPILNKNCVDCHNGEIPGAIDLRDTPVTDATMNKRLWSRSYLNLTEAKQERPGNYQSHPEGGFVTWISKMSRPTELPPKFSGAIKSPLLQMLNDGHHGVALSEEEYQKLATWMDLLVPFCGTYREAHQWNASEMSFYDYFEAKRHVQHEEERQAISDYLASLEGRNESPREQTGPNAPSNFTQAAYQPLPATIDASSDNEKILRIAADSPFLFDRLTLQVDAKDPVSVKLFHKGKPVHQFTFDADSDTQSWHSGGRPMRNQDVEFRVEGTLSKATIEVHGISEHLLPNSDGYKRHLMN